MNCKEHLLECLSEECSEVSQAVSKALRFGLNDRPPLSEATNGELICKELNDLMAMVEMLQENKILEYRRNVLAIAEKKEKVLKYLDYAKFQGTVKDELS